MPKLAIHSTVWILTLLFCLAVTKNKTYPEENVYFIDPREDKSAHDSSGSFCKQRPNRGDKSLEAVVSGFPNETLRFRAVGDINLEGYKNASLNTRTLMDYNGPVIIEDLDDMNDQNLTSHIRVKRNEPIVHHRSSSMNLLPRNSQRRTDVISIFNDSTKGSRLDYENQSDIIVNTMVPHSRHKRGVLSENGHRRKRVKGNIGHSKHNVEKKNKNKKHDALKSPHQLVTKKTKNPTSGKRNKNTQEMSAKTINELRTESRIEKRESRNSDFNTGSVNDYAETLIGRKDASLINNNRSILEQRQENAIMLPFVHTGRAELHVRIEKIPTNESSFISSNSHWTDRFAGTSPCSITLPKYNTSDETLDVNVTNVGPNFDFAERKKADNVTVEIMLKKQGNNASSQETNDSKNTSFYNAEIEAEAHPVESNVLRIENNRNTEERKYDRTNEMSVELSDEDAKLRAKRNQQVMSKYYLQNDKNSKESLHFKDTEQEIGDTKREKTRYRRIRGNRAVRSIEEIKNLAEKLIAKINELQVYVSNRNETLCERDSCKKNAEPAITTKEPRIFLKKKDVSSSTANIAGNVSNRQRFTKEAILAGKRGSQMRSNGSRFARGEYQTRRRSRRKWGRWMDWSSCSVTCGKGRQIRWRHCLHDCNDAETEMEEKACQLPACPPMHQRCCLYYNY